MGAHPTQTIHHKMQLWRVIIHHIFPARYSVTEWWDSRARSEERGAAMQALAIPICTKCKREVATSNRKEVLCEPCAAKVRAAEAARKRAGDKKRKGELLTAKQSVALSQAPAVLLKQAVSKPFPCEVVYRLCVMITGDKKKADDNGPVPGHCEQILGGYGELHVRWGSTMHSQHECYEKYDKVMKPGHAGDKEVQNLLTEATKASVSAFEKQAVLRAQNPVVIRNVAVLAQMGYTGLSSTLGPANWTAKDTPGQCLHTDVMLPEVRGIAYWSAGVGTQAFNGEEMSYDIMESITGMTASDF